MNFSKVFNMIAENNVNPEDVFKIVEKVKNSNLKDERNIRLLIQEVSRLVKKPIDKNKEDALVRKILTDGVNDDLLNMI